MAFILPYESKLDQYINIFNMHGNTYTNVYKIRL